MTTTEERQARMQLARVYPQFMVVADNVELNVIEHSSGALIVKPVGDLLDFNGATIIIPLTQRLYGPIVQTGITKC